jgi:hypothetical protein
MNGFDPMCLFVQQGGKGELRIERVRGVMGSPSGQHRSRLPGSWIDRCAACEYRSEHDPHCFGHILVPRHVVLRLVTHAISQHDESILPSEQECWEASVTFGLTEARI